MGAEVDQAPGGRGQGHAEVDPHGADALDGGGDEEVHAAKVSWLHYVLVKILTNKKREHIIGKDSMLT